MPESFNEAIDAPTVIGRPTGKDEGNSFCFGGCYATQAEAPCEQPYVSFSSSFSSSFSLSFSSSFLLSFSVIAVFYSREKGKERVLSGINDVIDTD